MPDRPEIPRDLAHRLADWLRAGVTESLTGTWGERTQLVAELDALEQPPDPAEVAFSELRRLGLLSHNGEVPENSVPTIRQAHAERDEAVKAFLTIHKEVKMPFRTAHHQGSETTDCPACIAAARVRKLFGLDKENP